MRSKRTKQLISGFVIIAMAIAAKIFLIQHFRIPQNGMYPGLPAGSRFWAYKRAYTRPTQVKRGDTIWLVTDPAAHAERMLQLGKSSYYLDLELLRLEEFGADVITKFT